MAATDVEVRPWGGKGGTNPWTFKPNGRFSEIRIRGGGCIDSIRFTYTDQNGVPHNSQTYGGDGGSAQTITFANDEKLRTLSGLAELLEHMRASS